MATCGNARILPLAVLLAVWWLTFGQSAHAQTPEPSVTPKTAEPPGGLPYDEAEAQAIDGMIMCPVCPAETIDQAQVPLSRQMRAIVRQKLSEGATRQEILDFFAERYGQSIIGAPPKSGVNLVAWVLPPVAVALALLGGAWSLRSMSAGRKAAAAASDAGPVNPPGLEPYLQLVDRETVAPQSESTASPPDSGADLPGRADGPGPGLDTRSGIDGDRHG